MRIIWHHKLWFSIYLTLLFWIIILCYKRLIFFFSCSYASCEICSYTFAWGGIKLRITVPSSRQGRCFSRKVFWGEGQSWLLNAVPYSTFESTRPAGKSFSKRLDQMVSRCNYNLSKAYGSFARSFLKLMGRSIKRE